MLRRKRVFIWILALAAASTNACQVTVEPEEDASPPEQAFPGDSEEEPWEDPWAPEDPPPPGSPPEDDPSEEPPEPPYEVPAPAPAPQSRRPVAPFRELLIVSPALVSSDRASSGNPEASWSFRRLLTWMAGEGEAAALARDWLDSWQRVTRVGAYDAPVTPRPAVLELLTEPWFMPDAVDAAPAYYGPPPEAEDTALWKRTPFELLAIVNRIDLFDQACSGSAGELRFVFSPMHPTSRAFLEMTVIVEVPYPRTRTPAEWARAWHAVAAASTEEAYRAELARLTEEVLLDAEPLGARVRTNEVALGAESGLPWELREFRLEDGASGPRLVMVPLEATPRSDLEARTLAEHLVTNADQIAQGLVPLPEALRAGAAHLFRPDFSWPAPTVSDELRRAFSRNTCNGCHGGDSETLPFQHIGPPPAGASRGQARLSRFLYSTTGNTDELRRRTKALESLLAASCAEPPADYGD